MNRKTFNTVKFVKLVALLAVIGAYVACNKADDYKKFTEGGEISYPGKIDSVKIKSGRNRVQLNALFLADPKVVQCRVYWNNFKDSLVFPVVKKAAVDSLSVFVPNVTEGLQSFTIYTYDKNGNRSIAVNRTGTSYGARYEQSLSNRPINIAQTGSNGVTQIEWFGMDRLTGVFATEVQYTTTDNKQVTIKVPIDETSTTLANFKTKSSIKYRTLFLPDTVCVDTFKTDYTTRYLAMYVEEDVTSTYLKNVGPNLTRGTWDGSRWGTLADWTTTAGAKNITNNLYGGYEFRDKVGVISFESGWGINTPVTNGLIYQTITLPAGSYSFQLKGLDQNSGGQRYIAVAAGNTLPSVANITGSSIAYANISDGELKFTLAEERTVSIGFAVSIANTGQYIKIGSVKLIKQSYQ